MEDTILNCPLMWDLEGGSLMDTEGRGFQDQTEYLSGKNLSITSKCDPCDADGQRAS